GTGIPYPNASTVGSNPDVVRIKLHKAADKSIWKIFICRFNSVIRFNLVFKKIQKADATFGGAKPFPMRSIYVYRMDQIGEDGIRFYFVFGELSESLFL